MVLVTVKRAKAPAKDLAITALSTPTSTLYAGVYTHQY